MKRQKNAQGKEDRIDGAGTKIEYMVRNTKVGQKLGRKVMKREKENKRLMNTQKEKNR